MRKTKITFLESEVMAVDSYITKLEVETKLKYILYRLFKSEEEEDGPVEVDEDVFFSDYKLNSIQFLEFIIEIEEEFGIDVSDDILVDSANRNISEWAEYIMQISTKTGE